MIKVIIQSDMQLTKHCATVRSVPQYTNVFDDKDV